MQRQQMIKPKAEQGKISKKEFERQLGISVFLSIVCSLVAFIPVTVLIQMFLGDIPGLFAISAIITYGFFQTIFYKMAQAGQFINWKEPDQNQKKWKILQTKRSPNTISDIEYRSLSSNIYHHKS